MSKTISISALPRLTIVSILDELVKKGGFSLRDIVGYQKLMERLDLTAEEREALNVRTVVAVKSNETNVTKEVTIEEFQKLNKEEWEVAGGLQMRWDARKGGTEDGEEVDVPIALELPNQMAKTLTAVLKRWNDDKLFSMETFKAIEPIIEALGCYEELELDKPEEEEEKE